ncbi:MAG: aldehyde ferredoxin oxidoreductase family protein [Thermodesulfobacteriota bacterium]
MNLYAGKILSVDLTSRDVSVRPLRQEWLPEYWGGWGLAARYYYDLARAGTDPLAPENPLVIMTGPFCGTLVPTSARFCLVSRSPHTGTVFESNMGGAFGPELKMAGYDGLIITGRASAPVYIVIKDDQAAVQDAGEIWGRGIFETEVLLKEAAGSPEAKCLAIGPAGENKLTFACVGSEAFRQLGRGGAGALFGAKNLKGIACRGTGAVAVADMKAFLDKVDYYKEHSVLQDANLWACQAGTSLLVDVTNEMGCHPTRNFARGVNEGKAGINADAIARAKIADRACTSCPLACGKFTRLGRAEVEGPEYETLCLAGSNCEINDLEAIIRFNRLCDDLGLDTITAGNVIGLAMDLTEKGIHDFGLRFGQVESYLQAVSEMAGLSTDRGRDLALGARKLADKYNAAHLAAQVKGLEMPAYEPRANYGMGLAYATSERGACHLRAFTIFSAQPFDLETMAQEVVAGQNLAAVKWSMCFCDFWGNVDTAIMADLLSTGLGREVTALELDLAGERIWNLLRVINVREGFSGDQDVLPDKMLQALLKGSQEGRVLARADFLTMRRHYYSRRQWGEDGRPTPAILERLRLNRL